MSKQRKTTAEILNDLEKNIEYQEIRKAKEEAHITLERNLRHEAKELIEELKTVGVDVSSVWDLVNTKESYPNAIQILIAHLSKDYHDRNKEGIIRALAVKEAIGKAGDILIAEYNKIPKEKMMLRWAIGNTIYTTIKQEDIEGVLSIIKNKENGMSRQMFVVALGKVKSDKSEDILIELLDDDEVIPHALQALGLLKSQKAKEKIGALINHPKGLIRKEALKALKKIG